jgi:hypothetical protein
MLKKSNHYEESVLELAQSRTAEFVYGLEAGLKPDYSIDMTKYKTERGMVDALSRVVFSTEEFKVKLLELIDGHDWEGNCALLKGMEEGVAYRVSEHLKGQAA